jgi:hypothetical protein
VASSSVRLLSVVKIIRAEIRRYQIKAGIRPQDSGKKRTPTSPPTDEYKKETEFGTGLNATDVKNLSSLVQLYTDIMGEKSVLFAKKTGDDNLKKMSKHELMNLVKKSDEP